MAAAGFRLDWDVSGVKRLQGLTRRAEIALYAELGQGLVDLIRSKIRSRSGELAESWHWRRIGSTLRISSRSPYVYPSVKGAFIRPTHGRALVFEMAGRTVFASRVRYPPGAYMGRRRGAGSSKSYLDAAVREFAAIVGTTWRKALRAALH